jgi:MoxR-like ATPase
VYPPPGRVGTVVVGQDVVVERLLIALFTGGHLLLQGVPGLAKTLLVNALSKSIDLEFAACSSPSTCLPSDILGSEILDQRTNEFRVHKGPIFTNLLLADEINRAAPKVQGALLEAMQERKVTIGNETFRLPAPFLVIATQNPVEQAGTFELPEAQLDRFMLVHRLDYPTPDEEREVLRRNARWASSAGGRRDRADRVRRAEEGARGLDRRPRGAMEPCTACTSARPSSSTWSTSSTARASHPAIELGCSPRAGISLVKASRARALMHGRHYVDARGPVRPRRGRDAAPHAPQVRGDRRGRTGRQVLDELLRADGRRDFGLRPPRSSARRSAARWKGTSRTDTLDARQFAIAIRKLADSLSYGIDKLAVLGSGRRVRAVAALPVGRPDPRDRLARHGAHAPAHVKEYEAPKSVPCYLLVDTSASMTSSVGSAQQVRHGALHRRRPRAGVPRPRQPGRRDRRGRARAARPARACRPRA